MTIQQAPRGKVTQRLLGAVTALLLGAWTFPSLAATGTETRSDPSMDAPPLSLSPGHELPIRPIDRGADGAVDPESLPLEAPAAETPVDVAEPLGEPRVEVMLRRIFDEARAREPRLQQPRHDEGLNAPLAVDTTEALEDTPGLLLEDDPTEAAAGFPGFGADDVLRYRQQMYRTDI